MNGAVERAVRSWEGQFRTVRDHLEGEIAATVAMVCLVGVVDPQSMCGEAKWSYYVGAHHWPSNQIACCEFRPACALEIASQEIGRRQTRP